MKMPLVSIIIPCYNVKKYLQDAVESAVKQTYSNIEIILVDDGATDGTSELCDSFSEKYENIRVIHKENGGLSSARNVGMADAKGEYLYFLDSDDFIENITIENLVYKMQDNNLEVILFNSYNVNEEGTVIDKADRVAKIDNKVYRGIEAYQLFWTTDVYSACVPFHFYNKSFLDSFSLSFADGIIHEDELFNFYTYRFAKRIMYDEHKYYFRRIRENSIMTSSDYLDKKFESAVWITKAVANRNNWSQFSVAEGKYVMQFLNRIQELMCARFNEMTWTQKRKKGREYRKCLKMCIVFAISKRQFSSVPLPVKRYILSLYSLAKRD